MQAKIALLAKLAFGQDVALDKVPCAGISKLSSADFSCAKVSPANVGLLPHVDHVSTVASTGVGACVVACVPTGRVLN